MKLESQVVSLELAKKLKELGVNQNSLAFWVSGENQSPIVLINFQIGQRNISGDKLSRIASAFTSAELGMIMPEINFQTYREKSGWVITDHQINLPVEKAKTEANARAKILIYLIENKLINL